MNNVPTVIFTDLGVIHAKLTDILGFRDIVVALLDDNHIVKIGDGDNAPVFLDSTRFIQWLGA